LKVVVKPYLFLRQVLGYKEAVLDVPEGTNVHQLLHILRREHKMPEKFNTAGGQITLMEDEKIVGLVVLVDGRNIKQLQGLNTVLGDGAVINLFPPAAGG